MGTSDEPSILGKDTFPHDLDGDSMVFRIAHQMEGGTKESNCRLRHRHKNGR